MAKTKEEKCQKILNALNLFIQSTNGIRDIVHAVLRDKMVLYGDVEVTVSEAKRTAVLDKWDAVKDEHVALMNAIDLYEEIEETEKEKEK